MRNVFISGISLAGILIFRVLLKMLRLESNKLAMELLVMFFISVFHFPTYNRASDRVRQKMGNSAAFSREIMWQKRAIMRQIMRFF